MEQYIYEGVSSSNLMPEGDYEVIIERMNRQTLPSGKEKLSIMYRVRGDIEGQSYGNKCIFEDIWQEKENPKYFNRKRINQLRGTQNIEKGKVCATINDVINELLGARLILHIDIVFDDYRGEEVNRVAYYKSSKYKPQELIEDEGFVLDDDDLPF